MRVVIVSPGFIETNAATRMIERMAEKRKQRLRDRTAKTDGHAWWNSAGEATGPRRSPSWSPSLRQTGRLQSPEPSSSSTVEPFELFITLLPLFQNFSSQVRRSTSNLNGYYQGSVRLSHSRLQKSGYLSRGWRSGLPAKGAKSGSIRVQDLSAKTNKARFRRLTGILPCCCCSCALD